MLYGPSGYQQNRSENCIFPLPVEEKGSFLFWGLLGPSWGLLGSPGATWGAPGDLLWGFLGVLVPPGVSWELPLVGDLNPSLPMRALLAWRAAFN